MKPVAREVHAVKGTRRKRTRIVLLGWYGSDNVGDEAVLQAVVEALRSRGLHDLHVLSVNPAKTLTRLNLPASPRSLLHPRTLRAMWGARALVLGGGGLIQDGTSVYNLPLYALFVAVARLLGLKVVGWGLGVEPVWTLLGKLLTRFICGASHHFSVRDHMSLCLLQRAGVPTHRVKVTADPAFLIAPEPVPDPRRGGKPLVIFCLRQLSDNHPGLNLHYLLPVSVRTRLGLGWRPPPARRERFVQALAQAVGVCVRRLGADVVLLPLWPGRDDDMLLAVEQAAARLGVPGERLRRAQVEPSPGKVAGYISYADMLVSMRLHSIIFAVSEGVPVLALAYARKVQGVMRELGAARWVVEVDLRVPSPEELEHKIRRLWEEREEEGVRLCAAACPAAARAEADADDIAKLLSYA
jgi:polysaccharide pyruvyl transferase CsaB